MQICFHFGRWLKRKKEKKKEKEILSLSRLQTIYIIFTLLCVVLYKRVIAAWSHFVYKIPQYVATNYTFTLLQKYTPTITGYWWYCSLHQAMVQPEHWLFYDANVSSPWETEVSDSASSWSTMEIVTVCCMLTKTEWPRTYYVFAFELFFFSLQTMFILDPFQLMELSHLRGLSHLRVCTFFSLPFLTFLLSSLMFDVDKMRFDLWS